MTNELKPCPFCGGEVELRTYSTVQSSSGAYVNVYPAYQLRCSNCNLMIECADIYETLNESKEKLIEAWNRRTNHE